MNHSRRRFLSVSAAAACATQLPAASIRAAEPPVRPDGFGFKLSLAAYSFNRQLVRRGTPEQLDNAELTLEGVIDFAAEQQLDGVELTSYYFPKVVTQDYLLSLKQRTHRLGLAISGTAIGNDFCLPPGAEREAQLADCRAWIDHAAVMGAPVIRIFAGRVPQGGVEAEAIALCAAGINESLRYAATKGVFLALENHGGITATPAEMLKIIEQVDDSPWFGVNFDSGNFHTADPYADLAQIAPWAVNAQIKVRIHPQDEERRQADFVRLIGILREARYRGYVVLEYEEGQPFEEIPRYLQQLRDAIQA